MVKENCHKVVLIVALKAEAKFLIKNMGLKRSKDHTWSCYESNRIDLVISGAGKQNAERAARSVLERYQLPTICNFGVCGSRSKAYDIGTPIYINSIYDSLSKKSYFPDPLVRHKFREAGLVTHAEAQDENSLNLLKHCPLVDMEAAFICRVVDKNIPWQRVHALKVVSDHLAHKHVNASFVDDLISNSFNVITDFINKLYDNRLNKTVVDDVTLEKISNLFETLKLSSSQRKKLTRLLLYKYSSGDTDLSLLNYNISAFKINKHSRNIIFSEICSEILQ